MAKHPPEQLKNGFEDDDFRTVIQEIEDADDEAETVMATARGKVSGIRTRQKNRIKIAKQELNIPSDVLRAVLKQRKLERKLKMLAESVSDDLVEVYVDASGQFSLFGASDEPAAQVAAREHQSDIEKITEAEQAEGENVLNELAGAGLH
jgi:uncharacterized protein (DUF849 family)